ncbi:protein-tyrosine-phosphatase [Muribacter muris]|uniref:Protein-tyrosine-phosphatase n=2 Tax=Muribacter muris TaxID=67855 RepID=A0A4Y9JZ31_9PAST|nr:tyrosine-protein phosphatase [Muribacter muris]MBF0826340.1 tyrosine-protein phosphatase [Muribacter muris]TFV09745.1 protein-tyrosine-phosphatase [Muribacter muris]
MRHSLTVLALLLPLAACQTPISNPVERPSHWATVINKASNLYRLDERLFRSEQLQATDYPLLKQQGIRTLINLRFFDRNDDKHAFGNQDLTLINTPLLTWHITPIEVAGVLWQIEQAQQRGGVLVHCYHGADRTGLISAMYRVIYQNWSIEEAKREMLEGDYGFHSIWKNIERLFSADNVQQIKQELARLRAN